MEIIREFFGIGGYTREPSGAYSWQHLTFVGVLLAVMTLLAVWLGRRKRTRDEKAQNKVLIWTALLIDGLELIKIVLACYTKQLGGEPWTDGILYNLPLFLCSIQLIVIPLAAFSKGRVRAASLDFVAIFGLLGAVLGTVGAAQNYTYYPVLGFDNVVSGLTHSLSGFAALYVLIVGMAHLRPRDSGLTVGILTVFCAAAYGVNTWVVPRNYMFLMQGDGTPYDVLYNLVGGSPVWYPLGVIALFFAYIAAYYGVVALLRRRKKAKTPVTVA